MGVFVRPAARSVVASRVVSQFIISQKLKLVGGLTPVLMAGILSLAPMAHASQRSGDGPIDFNDCAGLLTVGGVANESLVLAGSHSFLDLIATDPAQNLAVKYPAIVMNAAQRVVSWMGINGPDARLHVRRALDLEYGSREVNVYPLFSDGLPETSGVRIVGQHAAIQVLVDYVTAQARGDTSNSKIPLFIGPPGTGKSALIKALLNAANHATRQNGPTAMWTVTWKNLGSIDALRPFFLQSEAADGTAQMRDYRCPINDSPFTLLPEELQTPVLNLARERVRDLIGVEPSPQNKPCPHCEFIRHKILEQYMAQHGVTSLSPTQIVQVLSRHLRVDPFVIGAFGDRPVLDALGRDVDWAQLFGAPNPMVRAMEGPGHPLATFLNGAVLRWNGAVGLIDEYWRNISELRDVFLGIIQDRQVSRSGPTVPLDVVVFGASNNESVRQAMENSASRAQLDRMRLVPLPLLKTPHPVAETALMMKYPRGLRQRRLSTDADSELAPLTRANLREIFPTPTSGAPFLGPDGRFALYIETDGNRQVHLSPHTLMYMADLVTATRLSTNAAAAAKLNPTSKIVHSPIFANLMMRLEVLHRTATINDAERAELDALSTMLEEGQFGISARDFAETWLPAVVAEAQRPENNGCVTPIVAKNVLKRLLNDGVIATPDNTTRLRWLTMSEAIMTHFVVPGLASDVQSGVAGSGGQADALYDEVFQELLALADNDTATMYTPAQGASPRPINRDRLGEIRRLYQLAERRDLDAQSILIFNARNHMRSTEQVRDPGLLRAVVAWSANRVADLVPYDQLLTYGLNQNGTADTGSRYSALSNHMQRRLGYCPHCMSAALGLVHQREAGQRQANGGGR